MQNRKMEPRQRTFAFWLARLVVGGVFLMNVSCALAFILQPERYAPGFEIGGEPGRIVVQGFGILFLMWNTTYPLVLIDPGRYRALFGVVLGQQMVGLLGETWLLRSVPMAHAAIRATGWRFIIFDGLGWVVMTIAYVYLLLGSRKTRT